MGDLIAVLLAPYEETEAFAGRIRVAVPRMGIGEQSATTLALVVHELATNSLKYGALSVGTGILDISGTVDDDQVVVVWTERGGPSVDAKRGEGYGSKLLNRSVAGQLGGSIATEWSEEGVIVKLAMDARRLAS